MSGAEPEGYRLATALTSTLYLNLPCDTDLRFRLQVQASCFQLLQYQPGAQRRKEALVYSVPAQLSAWDSSFWWAIYPGATSGYMFQIQNHCRIFKKNKPSRDSPPKKILKQETHRNPEPRSLPGFEICISYCQSPLPRRTCQVPLREVSGVSGFRV